MNFLLSDEQLAIVEAVRRVLAERCDALQLHKVFDGDSGFDAALWSALAETGVAGIAIMDDHGGLGLELTDAAIVAEELGRTAAPVPFLSHSLAALAIQLGGSAEQKATWLPKLASGEVIGAIAFAEGEGQWQPEHWQLPASNALNGEKQFVEGAAQADVFIVGTQGGGLVLVEANASGLDISPLDSLDRTRRFSRLRFSETPAQALPKGAEVSARLRDAALTLLAADAFGGASRCVDMAMDYAKVREQFGTPIGRFQGLKHQLANMAVEVEPARGLYWFAAHAWDHIVDQSARAAALAKAHLADRYLQAARDMVEAHGGIGYTWEFDAQIYIKRAMFDYAVFGVPAEHRARSATMAGW
ncbi:MAG: acyl-CoA dehydrogenase family protein [Pseudoxanthomonas sp.]